MRLKNMPLVDVPPGQVDETEAALLALGATIDWQDVDLFTSYGYTDEGGYIVNCVGGRPRRWTVFASMREGYQAGGFDKAFRSLRAAKAACERHYASRIQSIREGAMGLNTMDNMDELEHLTLEDARGMVALLEKALVNAKAKNAAAEDIREIEKTLEMLNRKIATLLK